MSNRRLHRRKEKTEGEFWRDAGYRAVMKFGTPQDKDAAMRRRMWVRKYYHGGAGKVQVLERPMELSVQHEPALNIWLPTEFSQAA